MRRALIVLASLILLAIAALAAVPVLFGDKLVTLVRGELDRYVDADIAVGRAEVTLLSSFPDLTVQLGDLRVTGREPFAGVELATLDQLEVTVDLMSVITGDRVVVRGIYARTGALSLVVDAEGRSNLDLFGPSDSSASSSTELELADLELDRIDLRYEDQQANRLVTAAGISLSSRADIGADSTSAEARGSVSRLTVQDGGTTWLRDVALTLDTAVAIDAETGLIELGDTSLGLNDLATTFSGAITPIGEDVDLDLRFAAAQTGFKSLLSLVPAIYSKDYAGLVAAGSMGLDGDVKGRWVSGSDDLPAFSVALTVIDGRFQFPDLPSDISDVQIAARVAHPGGLPDLVEVDVERFALSLAGAPLHGRLSLRHPQTDPSIDLAMKGSIDLARLADIVPPDPGVVTTGSVDVDLSLAGRVSDFEAKRLDKVRAQGAIRLVGVHHSDPALPEEIIIDKLEVAIAPAALDMADLSVRFGRSDLRASGKIDNALAWALTDAPLVGRLEVRSSLLDLGPYMNDDEDAPSTDGDSSLVAVPTNLDLSLDAKLARVLTDVYDLTDVRGTVQVKDGVISLRQVQGDTLGGQVQLSGTYTAPTDRYADVDLDVTLRTMDLSQTMETVRTLQQVVPVARKAKGRFSSTINVQARLRPDLSPELQSLSSDGGLQASGVEVSPAFMAKVGALVGNDQLGKVSLSDQGLAFRIREGRLNLLDVPLRIGRGTATLRGSTGVVDQTLDLAMDMLLPLGDVKAPGLLGQIGQAAAPGGKLPLTATIGGTFSDPKVSLEASSLTDAITAQVGAVVDQVQEEVTARVQAGLDSLVAEAQKQGDKLVAEAEKAADSLRAEARSQAAKLRTQAKKQGDKLISEAKGNPLKEAAAKKAAQELVKQADKQADKLESEADKTGKAGVTKAKSERDKLIASAEAKAKVR